MSMYDYQACFIFLNTEGFEYRPIYLSPRIMNPYEIQCIASFLRLEDRLTLRRVCPAMMAAIPMGRFPSRREHSYASLLIDCANDGDDILWLKIFNYVMRGLPQRDVAPRCDFPRIDIPAHRIACPTRRNTNPRNPPLECLCQCVACTRAIWEGRHEIHCVRAAVFYSVAIAARNGHFKIYDAAFKYFMTPPKEIGLNGGSITPPNILELNLAQAFVSYSKNIDLARRFIAHHYISRLVLAYDIAQTNILYPILFERQYNPWLVLAFAAENGDREMCKALTPPLSRAAIPANSDSPLKLTPIEQSCCQIVSMMCSFAALGGHMDLLLRALELYDTTHTAGYSSFGIHSGEIISNLAMSATPIYATLTLEKQRELCLLWYQWIKRPPNAIFARLFPNTEIECNFLLESIGRVNGACPLFMELVQRIHDDGIPLNWSLIMHSMQPDQMCKLDVTFINTYGVRHDLSDILMTKINAHTEYSFDLRWSPAHPGNASRLRHVSAVVELCCRVGIDRINVAGIHNERLAMFLWHTLRLCRRLRITSFVNKVYDAWINHFFTDEGDPTAFVIRLLPIAVIITDSAIYVSNAIRQVWQRFRSLF